MKKPKQVYTTGFAHIMNENSFPSGRVTDIANTVYLLISENLLDYSVVIDNDNPIIPNNVYCKE